MANIAISELDTETTSLGDNDLLLVSKDNGGSYTSAKMKGSVLKSGVSGCQFSEDTVKNALTSYGATKSTDLSKLSTLTASDIKTQCQSALTTYGAVTNSNISSNFITYDVSKFVDLEYDTYTELQYDSYILFRQYSYHVNPVTCQLWVKYNSIENMIYSIYTKGTANNDDCKYDKIFLPMKKGLSIKFKAIENNATERLVKAAFLCMIMPCI